MQAMSTRTKEQMLAMRLSGLTYAQIGETAGVSRQRVQQLLRPPAAVRDEVVERFQGRCATCTILVGQSGQVHLGRWNDIGNLELLCVSCHLAKHTTEIVLRDAGRHGLIP